MKEEKSEVTFNMDINPLSLVVWAGILLMLFVFFGIVITVGAVVLVVFLAVEKVLDEWQRYKWRKSDERKELEAFKHKSNC